MRKITNNRILILISTIIILPVIIPYCESLKEDPAYVATWEYKDKLYAGELTYNTTRTLALTKTTYEEVYVIQRDNSSTVVTILGLKGDMTVNGNKMTFNLKELGACIKDAQDKCTSGVRWYGPGTQYYTDNIQYFRQTIVAEFEADEDYLWLVRDTNGDGDTEDTGEDIEFERI